jgi:CRP-like cAMP-binding protein
MHEKQIILDEFSNASFTPDEMQAILDAFVPVEFKKDDFLFREGSVLNQYYFLERGFVRSYAIDYDGHEITTQFYSPPAIVIDWVSFMLRTPTKEHFQAVTDCFCWSLTNTKFQELFHGIKGFRESGRQRFASGYFKLKEHHLSVISKTAKERYLELIQNHPEILHNASLKHIATYLGITDTSLSRIRKEIVQS